MRRILVYKADQERGREWREILARDAPDIEFRMWPDTGPADEVIRFPVEEVGWDFRRARPSIG